MGFQSLKQNKKGFVGDIIFILVFIFITVISIAAGYMIYHNYTDSIANVQAFNTSENANITAMAFTTLNSFDYSFIFIVVGLVILTIISTFSIQTHPIFFFISSLLLVIAVIFAGVFANVFEIIMGKAAFSGASAQYVVITYFMDHLPTMMLIIGAILLIILFAKGRMRE
jgi:hypothetical protein